MRELIRSRTSLPILLLHLFFVFFWVRQPTVITLSPKKQKVVVQTVTLRKPPPPKRTVVTKSKPKPKPKPKKKAVKKSKPAPSKTQQALAKARESLAKIDKVQKKQPEVRAESTPNVPRLRVDARPERATAVEASDYQDEMARRLRLLLRLPDYGAVRVQVTITKRGAVSGLEVVNAASEINRAYIEQVLPTLTFAPLNNHFGQVPNKTFTLTLENDPL